MKLNIGAGATALEGYTPWDIKQGRRAYPLDLPEGTVEAIYASHVLEHFPHAQTMAVLRDWVRVLQPGGTLQVAVPDFDRIVAGYQARQQGPWEQYLLGGQVDADDHHKAVFNQQKLAQCLHAAGLEKIRTWKSTIQDCAALPISLNLAGDKPAATTAPPPAPPAVEVAAAAAPPAAASPNVTVADPTAAPPKAGLAKVVAVWSTPRLAFMDTWMSIYKTLPSYGIPLCRGAGVFWGQAMTAAMKSAIEANAAQWLLALDYDSVFEPADLAALMEIVNRHPQEIDALCPFQWSRCRNSPLWTPPMNADGTLPSVTDAQLLATDHFPIGTGHFGLTLIRADVVKRMPHPWFLPVPSKDGTWGDGKMDDDIYFWRGFAKAGGRIFLAPSVTIGHCELDVRWPGQRFELLHQHINDYNDHGKPAGVFGTRPHTNPQGQPQ